MGQWDTCPLDFQQFNFYHTQRIAQGSVFGTVYDFFCLCMKYLGNR